MYFLILTSLKIFPLSVQVTCGMFFRLLRSSDRVKLLDGTSHTDWSSNAYEVSISVVVHWSICLMLRNRIS